MTEAERAEVLVTARLLASASRLSWLVVAVTAIAAAALALARFRAQTIVAVVAGVAGIYYAIRISFDARLLEDIIAMRLTTEAMDAALGRAGSERSWADRCAGARRLVVRCGAATLIQIAALIWAACA